MPIESAIRFIWNRYSELIFLTTFYLNLDGAPLNADDECHPTIMYSIEGRSRKGWALQVLKFETERQPGSLGSSVLGYNDAFAKLHPVLRQWRAKRAASPGGAVPVPYLVSADVSRAFDNVDANKLIDIVEPMLRSQEYLIVKHIEVQCLTLTA